MTRVLPVFISKRDSNRFAFEGGGDGAKAKKKPKKEPTNIMKKRLLRGIAIAAVTGFVLALRAQDTTTTDQSQYPTILQQPVDQCLSVVTEAFK